MAVNENVNIHVSLTDTASTGLSKLGKLITGVAVIQVGRKAVQAFTKWEKSLGDIETLLGGNKDALSKMEAGLKSLLKTVPVDPDDLGAAAYAVVSAGISDAADALIVLEQAAKLGVTGLGTTEEATDLLTSAINSFGLSIDDTGDTADIFFRTVKDGKNTIADLAASFGSVGPLAAAAGLQLDELQAATAAITVTGKSASEAQTGVAAAITALIKPNEKMLEIFQLLNVVTGEDLIESSGSLVGALDQVRFAAGELDILESKALGRKEALVTSITLLGEQNGAYTKTLEGMRGGTDLLNAAYEKQKEKTDALFQVMKNRLFLVLVELGTIIVPPLIIVLELLLKAIELLAEGATLLVQTWKDMWADIVGITETAAKKITDLVDTVVAGLKRLLQGKAAVAGAKAASLPAFSMPTNAFGGPVTGGRPTLVGENGPEIFVPSTKGNIIPGGGGGGISIVINGDVSGEEIAEKIGDIIIGKLKMHSSIVGI